MYIRVTRNNRGQQYYHVVESCRINGKPRQKVLLSLGRVEDNQLDMLAKSIAKYTKQVKLVDLAKDISIDNTFILGPLLVIEQLSKKATAKTFVSNYNYRRFIKGLDSSEQPLINDDAILEAKKRDGFFAILTNVSDRSAQEITSHYRQLWKIEDAFGELKGTLKARPVFHWTDKRIIGHLTLCFIAYLCEAHITKCLRQHHAIRAGRGHKKNIIEERALSAKEALAELAELRAIPVKVQDETIWVRNEMGPNAKTLFAALHLRPPPRLLSKISEQNVV